MNGLDSWKCWMSKALEANDASNVRLYRYCWKKAERALRAHLRLQYIKEGEELGLNENDIDNILSIERENSVLCERIKKGERYVYVEKDVAKLQRYEHGLVVLKQELAENLTERETIIGII